MGPPRKKERAGRPPAQRAPGKSSKSWDAWYDATTLVIVVAVALYAARHWQSGSGSAAGLPLHRLPSRSDCDLPIWDVSGMTAEVFQELVRGREIPCLLVNVSGGWADVERWPLDALAEAHGGMRLRLKVARDVATKGQRPCSATIRAGA